MSKHSPESGKNTNLPLQKITPREISMYQQGRTEGEKERKELEARLRNRGGLPHPNYDLLHDLAWNITDGIPKVTTTGNVVGAYTGSEYNTLMTGINNDKRVWDKLSRLEQYECYNLFTLFTLRSDNVSFTLHYNPKVIYGEEQTRAIELIKTEIPDKVTIGFNSVFICTLNEMITKNGIDHDLLWPSETFILSNLKIKSTDSSVVSLHGEFFLSGYELGGIDMNGCDYMFFKKK